MRSKGGRGARTAFSVNEGQEWMAAKVKKGQTPKFPEDVESQRPEAGSYSQGRIRAAENLR